MTPKKMQVAAIFACLALFFFSISCGANNDLATPAVDTSPQPVAGSTTQPSTATTPDIHSLSLVKTVEIANGARPEIVQTADRVFVVYLNPAPSGKTFLVNIYSRDMSRIINSITLVSEDPTFGAPTDIRVVASDGFLYAFYETNNMSEKKTYLFGAKYVLDDNFARIAYTGPLAQGTDFRNAAPGNEKLDDPAPMLNGGEVTVMTRIKSTLAPSGETVYRFRKFDSSLKQQEYSPGVSTFDLDLSNYADGEARQSSIIFEDGYFYLAVQTAAGPSSAGNDSIIWTIPANLLIIKLDRDFKYVESRPLSADPAYTEGYVTGFRADDKYYYLTYNHVKVGTEFSSVIRIFDKNWNEVLTDKYKSAISGGLRPSIEICPGQVLAGNDDETSPKAYIYLFDKR